MLPPSPAVIGFYQPGQRYTARPQLLRLVTRQGTGDEKRPQRSSTRDGSRWLDRSWQRSQIALRHEARGCDRCGGRQAHMMYPGGSSSRRSSCCSQSVSRSRPSPPGSPGSSVDADPVGPPSICTWEIAIILSLLTEQDSAMPSHAGERSWEPVTIATPAFFYFGAQGPSILGDAPKGLPVNLASDLQWFYFLLPTSSSHLSPSCFLSFESCACSCIFSI